MLRNFPYVFSLLLVLVVGTVGYAEDYPATALVKTRAASLAENNRLTGWAYVISGGVALAASIPGYYLSEDVFAKAVYSVGQTLGVGTVGYGAYLLLIDNEFQNFQKILESAPDLTVSQREKLSRSFLAQNAERAKNVRKLRVITHSMMAGLNFLSGFTSSNKDLKLALCFIGGVNTIAAINFLVTTSEEEDTANQLPKLSVGLGTGVRLTLNF